MLIVVSIIGIIAALAVPGLLQARRAGNEASAVASLRVVSSSQTGFAASCGGDDPYDRDVDLTSIEPRLYLLTRMIMDVAEGRAPVR